MRADDSLADVEARRQKREAQERWTRVGTRLAGHEDTAAIEVCLRRMRGLNEQDDYTLLAVSALQDALEARL